MAREKYETLQEVFDDAYRGLAAQGFELSVNEMFECAYRGGDGLKCALGHCIPDALYTPSMEGAGVDGGTLAGVFDGLDRDAIVDLQIAHDLSMTPEDMKLRLARFATNHGLTIPDLNA